MPIDFGQLKGVPRILITAELKPVAGTRIQPTGFPDLGAAVYDDPEGTPTLIVESAQSMANRLEAVCWDDATDDLVSGLKGLPYVRVKIAGIGSGSDTTCSLLEFHRLNSPYIISGVGADGVPFGDLIKKELGMRPAPAETKKGKSKDKPGATTPNDGGDEKERDDVAGVVNLRKLAEACFKYDPNSLVHGIFLEKIAGRLRHPRALSAFIEASHVGRADSGGVKFDRVLPKPKVAGVDAKAGYGNVPFHRTEFTAKTITAYFSLDLAQIRGYGLGDSAANLLVALSLWKIRRFLGSSMRLRSACELELKGDEAAIELKPAEKFKLPTAADLDAEVGNLIKQCKSLFAEPAMTELTWNKP